MLPISTAADGGTTFAFNFLAGGPAPSDAPLPPAALAPVCPAEEVYLPPGALPPSSADAVEVGKGVQLLRGCIPSNAAASALQEGEVERSDLVPGVYEGGFKLWEGAVDLCRYLCEEQGLDAAALTSTSSSPFRVRCKQKLPHRIVVWPLFQTFPCCNVYFPGNRTRLLCRSFRHHHVVITTF